MNNRLLTALVIAALLALAFLGGWALSAWRDRRAAKRAEACVNCDDPACDGCWGADTLPARRLAARMNAPAEDLGWHPMECGLCPETWWLPYGDTPYGTTVIDVAAEHWRGHVRRGEDPRVEAMKAGQAVSDS